MLKEKTDFYLQKLKENYESFNEKFSMTDSRALTHIEFLKGLDSQQILKYFDNLIHNIIKYTDYILIFTQNFSRDNNTEYLITSLEQKRKKIFNKLFHHKESQDIPLLLNSLYSQIVFYHNRINVIYNQMTEIKEQLFLSQSIMKIDENASELIYHDIEKSINNSLPTLALLEESIYTVKESIVNSQKTLHYYIEKYYPSFFQDQKYSLLSTFDREDSFESNNKNCQKVIGLKILKKNIMKEIYDFKEYNVYNEVKKIISYSEEKSSGIKSRIKAQEKTKQIYQKLEVCNSTLNRYKNILEKQIKDIDREDNQDVEDKINNMPLIAECKALLTEIDILKNENIQVLNNIK